MSLPIVYLDLDGEAANVGARLTEAGFTVLPAASLEKVRILAAEQPIAAVVAPDVPLAAAVQELGLPILWLTLGPATVKKHSTAPRARWLQLPEELAELPQALEDLTTNQRRAEPSIWRAVVDALPDAVVLLDERGNLLDCNQTASRLLGDELPRVVSAIARQEQRVHLADGRTASVKRTDLETQPPATLCLLQVEEPQAAETSSELPTDHDRAGGNERFRRLFEANIVPIYFWEADGRITDANDAFLALIECTPEALRRGELRWDTATAPEDLSLDQLAMSQFASGELVRASYEKRLLAGNKRRIPVLFGGAPLAERSNAGVAFVLDLSSRKRAEDALRESEERLSLALEAGRMGIFDWDLTTGQLAWSAYHYVLFGYRAGECTPSLDVWRRSVHPDDWPKVEETLQTAIAAGADFRHEYRVVLPGGEVRWLASAGRCQRDDGHRVVRLRGGVVDITDRKHVEQALRESEARARRIFHSDIVGVIYWDLESGQILDANNKFLEMTGYSREDLRRGTLFWNSMTPAEWAAPNAQAVAELNAWGRSKPYEKEYLRKDGSRVPVIVGGALFEGSQREGVSFVLDISDRKRSEEERSRMLVAERQRMARLLKLSEAATAINREDSIETILDTGAAFAANLIGAHQAGTSMTIGQQWSKATHAIWLSEKYAAWRDYSVRPDGTGIYGIVSRENRPLRLTRGRSARRIRPIAALAPRPSAIRHCAACWPRRSSVATAATWASSNFPTSSRGSSPRKTKRCSCRWRRSWRSRSRRRTCTKSCRRRTRGRDEFLATLAHELRNPLAAVERRSPVAAFAGSTR